MNDRHSSLPFPRRSEEVKNQAQTVGDCGHSFDREGIETVREVRPKDLLHVVDIGD